MAHVNKPQFELFTDLKKWIELLLDDEDVLALNGQQLFLVSLSEPQPDNIFSFDQLPDHFSCRLTVSEYPLNFKQFQTYCQAEQSLPEPKVISEETCTTPRQLWDALSRQVNQGLCGLAGR